MSGSKVLFSFLDRSAYYDSKDVKVESLTLGFFESPNIHEAPHQKISKNVIYSFLCPIIHIEITPWDIKVRKMKAQLFQWPIYIWFVHIKFAFGAHIFRSNLLCRISVGGAPCVSKWRMRCRDDNLLTPLIFAWLGSTAESYVVMVAAILNKPWGMHLFCIKPFRSDKSPWTADKYKFQRLDSCVHEHFGQESPRDISSTVHFTLQ